MAGGKVLQFFGMFALVALSVVVAGCVANVSQNINPQSQHIDVNEAQATPTTVTVHTSERVSISIKNTGSSTETFVINEVNANTGPVAPGETKVLVFTAPPAPVTYNIIASAKGKAVATVIVVQQATASASSTQGTASATASAYATAAPTYQPTAAPTYAPSATPY